MDGRAFNGIAPDNPGHDQEGSGMTIEEIMAGLRVLNPDATESALRSVASMMERYSATLRDSGNAKDVEWKRRGLERLISGYQIVGVEL